MFCQRVKTGIDARFGNRTLDDTGSRDMRSVGNRQMTTDHGSATDRTILAEDRAACNADTPRHRRVFTDMAVMTDLDLVIQLDAIFDNRVG